MPHPSGGRGTGRISHYHCQHKHLSSCTNSNKFEQIACGCHHKVLANELFNPHPSHAWHEGVPSFNPGGRKDAVYTGYGRPSSSNFHSSAVTSAIPSKAKQVQITCTQCKCKNAICMAWLFTRLKNKQPRQQCTKCKCIY